MFDLKRLKNTLTTVIQAVQSSQRADLIQGRVYVSTLDPKYHKTIFIVEPLVSPLHPMPDV